MGALITVVGNVGVGKTTFTQHLCAAMGYTAALESHVDRPFHHALATDRRAVALANQFDFLLHRADQERHIRAAPGVSVQDGGLDQDLMVFTRFLHEHGAISPREFALCLRLHEFARHLLPPPDLVIHLHAPIHILQARHAARNRAVEMIAAADIPQLERYVTEWVAAVAHAPVISIDNTADADLVATIAALHPRLHEFFGNAPDRAP